MPAGTPATSNAGAEAADASVAVLDATCHLVRKQVLLVRRLRAAGLISDQAATWLLAYADQTEATLDERRRHIRRPQPARTPRSG